MRGSVGGRSDGLERTTDERVRLQAGRYSNCREKRRTEKKRQEKTREATPKRRPGQGERKVLKSGGGGPAEEQHRDPFPRTPQKLRCLCLSVCRSSLADGAPLAKPTPVPTCMHASPLVPCMTARWTTAWDGHGATYLDMHAQQHQPPIFTLTKLYCASCAARCTASGRHDTLALG